MSYLCFFILYSCDPTAPVCVFYRIIRGIYRRRTLFLFGETIESFQESDLENRVFKNKSSGSVYLTLFDKQMLGSYSQNVIGLEVSPKPK